MRILVTGGFIERERKSNGTFARTTPVWVHENWNSGFLDSRGYFRVYRPDYPGAYKDGYAKRYHVVY